ncbi:hypothetical protein [Paraliomyxa miuraensis]|uniref:hypothetical protein n=1 Tax=Paraliomyxa miuraensis TaxID=376150 RepID=UPI002256659E|nr:hypothetical protein [Paraliomyxa miuraensis]MCX4247926.1 hypothetical protein [Paraliomyxa miuraensis]
MTLSTRRALGVMALMCLVSAPSASTVTASPLPSVTDQPILVIGASYANGKLPFDDDLQAPFGGLSVFSGSYLSEGDALVRKGSFVINEAQAGATTFDRPWCLDHVCLGVGWQGYATQLHKAAARVAIPSPVNPTQVLGYNASYVYISMANDCLHSGAAGVPQLASAPCSPAEVEAFVDRVISVGEDAMDLGLVPIFPRYPDYDDVDLATQGVATGLTWWVSEPQWNAISTAYETRIADELPGAILVDVWKGLETLPDGLHPTPKSAQKAAKRILDAIAEYEGH